MPCVAIHSQPLYERWLQLILVMPSSPACLVKRSTSLKLTQWLHHKQAMHLQLFQPAAEEGLPAIHACISKLASQASCSSGNMSVPACLAACSLLQLLAATAVGLCCMFVAAPMRCKLPMCQTQFLLKRCIANGVLQQCCCMTAAPPHLPCSI